MKRLGTWWVLLGALVLVACSNGSATEPRRVPAIPVVVANVERREVPLTLTAIGTVESSGSVNVQTRVDGQIVKVFVADGAEVKAGQPLIQIDPAPFQIQLRMAQATLARDQARFENARTKEAHGRALVKQRFISEDDHAQLKSDLDAADATVAMDRAAVDNAQLQLDYATIKAPVSGKLGVVNQKVGNTVHATAQSTTQTPLTTLNILDPVDVSFAIPEQQLGALRATLMSAPPEVDLGVSSSAGAPAHLTGKLSFVDNAADPTTGTLHLRARFPNTTRELWPGQFVTVTLHIGGDAQATVVPAVSLENGPEGTYVYVVNEHAVAEQRVVKVERMADTWAIVSGVEPGEQVVVDGQSRLQPGSPVARKNPSKPG
ncbi:MAG TPA: efflux RND transporter periplasmic adaptor subunit [Steroidobacteraceae bacterium]|nr:efflux RND transporter periplasmic adaptor subunit [Steroidobacteraceae bacterium]